MRSEPCGKASIEKAMRPSSLVSPTVTTPSVRERFASSDTARATSRFEAGTGRSDSFLYVAPGARRIVTRARASGWRERSLTITESVVGAGGRSCGSSRVPASAEACGLDGDREATRVPPWRSEEHTSELQSRENLVCRLLLEKKKQ